jgi:hypothetical protein
LGASPEWGESTIMVMLLLPHIFLFHASYILLQQQQSYFPEEEFISRQNKSTKTTLKKIKIIVKNTVVSMFILTRICPR